MKALLIGGTGTISMAISKQLLEQGWELTVLNRGGRNSGLNGCEVLCADIHDEAAAKSAIGNRSSYNKFQSG